MTRMMPTTLLAFLPVRPPTAFSAAAAVADAADVMTAPSRRPSAQRPGGWPTRSAQAKHVLCNATQRLNAQPPTS